MTEIPHVVYISGPITGYPDYNKSAFAEAANFLRNAGNVVLSPLELDTADDPNQVLPYEFYLHRDMHQMLEWRCNTICLLRGWHASFGAKSELQVAWALKWDVWYYDETEKKIIDMGRTS